MLVRVCAWRADGRNKFNVSKQAVATTVWMLGGQGRQFRLNDMAALAVALSHLNSSIPYVGSYVPHVPTSPDRADRRGITRARFCAAGIPYRTWC